MTSRRTDYPGEPELEEAGAIASGGSQNTEPSTWDTFSESTDSSKKDKKKTSMLGKARKNLKKAFKSSESPELARQLYESEQYKEEVRVKARQVEKVKDELQADFKKLQDKWKTEHAAFQSTIQEYQTGFIQLKQKVNSSKSEMQRLSQANKELKNKENEMQREFEVQVSGLETKNQVLTENLARSNEQLTQTQKSLDEARSDAKFQERELKYTQEKNASLEKEKLESSQTIDTLKADVKYMNGRMQNSEDELKKVQAELKTRTEEVLSFSKDKNESLVKFHNALKREKSLEVEKMELDKQILSLTKRLDQMVELEQTVQEHTVLQKTAKQWECMLEESKSKLEEERKHFTELQHMFDVKKHELQQAQHEYNEKKKESEIFQARVQHLENQVEHFNKEYQRLSQKLEQERSKLTVKHQEEMKVLMLKNAELKQQLRESMAIYEAAKQVPPHITKKIDDSISVSERIPSEVAQELQLLKPDDARSSGHLIRKQKSVELLTESSIQAGPNISMHSSAPGSLTKESSGEIKTNQEVTGLYSKSEDEYAQPYESPHTSLTEVVHSVTVTEDNMTDAVKLNIQQEVASLQQIVQPLQEENEKLRSELEALKIERDKLNKIKEKYFSLVSERADIYQKLNETESQSKASDEQTAPLAGPDVEMSLVAADINIHRESGGLSMETLLQDKDTEISELKAKLEHALSRAMSKDGLDQVEMSLREEHVDLRKATETLNLRFTSVRNELTRVQSQNSDVSMENEGLLRDITRLEEENLQLQSAVTKYKKKSEYWQQRCENEDIECRTAAQAAELTISMLQVDLNELERRLFRKENEVQTVKDCRKKLEEQLRINKEEKDRQDKQIAQLVAIKANLSNELSRYDSYAHDLGEFKQQSQQFKKTLSMKISEVEHLKEEKMALQKEIQSVKDELDIRKAEVSVIRQDFEEERKDRTRIASDLNDLKENWKKSIEEQVVKERQQTKFWESQFNEIREKWRIKQQDYETEITALSDQVESFRTTVEKQDLLIAQTESEYDAKLKMTESRLLKERQDHKQTRKDLNRVTEELQSTQQDYNMTVTHASEIQEELKEKVAALSADKSQLQEDLMQLKKEMQVKQKQYEHEKMTSEKNVKQLCEYVGDLQQTVSRMNEEKELLDGEIDKMKVLFQEERQHLTSVQKNLEVTVEESKKQHDKEKQQWINQLKSLDLLRKTMKSQLDEEKVRAEERSENISRLSRDVVTKEQAINKYEQEMLHLQECLQSMEYTNAQRERDITDLKRHTLKLERENQQLQAKTMQSSEPSEDYHRLNQEKFEIEQRRMETEKKYSSLMDDYLDLRKLAQNNGLKIPQMRAEEPLHFAHRPTPSSPYVQPYNPEVHNLKSENSIHGQQRAHTTYVSGAGPVLQAYSERPMAHPQYLAAEQGSHSPSAARVRRGSQDPSDVRRPSDAIRENVLIENIDDDISEAAANMEEKVVETSFVAEDDARPMDSNLICPLCGKQFRIGQIQHYRHHVDNCTNRPI